MIAVIFEVWPAEGEQDTYLALAAKLKAELAQVDGFISVERFESLAEPGKLLSLSFFRNGAAIKSWRNHPAHRTTQTRGRAGVFRDYRLRIAVVTRDYGLKDRMEAPSDSQSAHPT
jgi:heme-degrading monooxygenase HmoA